MKYAALALVLLAVINHTALAADTWKIAEREVPLPAGASEQLRRSIANWPVPDRARKQKLPTNKAEWLLALEQEERVENARIVEWPKSLEVHISPKKINGVAVSCLTPATLAEENKNRLFIHLHGGAYVFGGGDAGLGEGLLIANRLDIPVISIDYRMPPNHPFPAAVGVGADLHVYEGMSHAEYLFAIDSPESLDVFEELGKFVTKHL